MNKLDKMILEKDKLLLRLIKEGETKVTFENGKAVTWLRHWKSRKWKRLRNSEEKAGYIQHEIYRYGKRIKIRQHRLVWIYVNREIPPVGYVVHHIDEDRRNNHFSNLELLHRKNHLVHCGMYPNQKLTEKQRGRLIQEYKKVGGKKGGNRKGEVQELADKYGIHRAHLAKIVRRYREEKGELRKEA